MGLKKIYLLSLADYIKDGALYICARNRCPGSETRVGEQCFDDARGPWFKSVPLFFNSFPSEDSEKQQGGETGTMLRTASAGWLCSLTSPLTTKISEHWFQQSQ